MDRALFFFLNRLGCEPLDPLFRMLSHRFFILSAAFLACVFLAFRYRKRVWPILLALTCGVAASDLLGARLLKPLIGRTRPCYSLPPGTFRWVGPAANIGSMPSLHAANVFAAAFVITCAEPRLGPLAYFLALLIGFSRIYLGVHWPADVLAGALMGTATGWLAWTLVKAIGRRALQPPTKRE
jgi:undecaprenyl-diphosphatase